ncbi:serine/threonine-protein phosphatase 6 regulatory ankyrin repeat subunit B [Nymphalis io]|uniref:serine/threonine-protein phosphatase 6 regulatory ankyrin repeat subunit B n=1 Tax=Inachis io TaxID=171585 RepID=UPI002169FA89|nr:serine/threonine-protein phosphatase 6 regulatory ankyrin repeat subunit B [Nymphalis io]
MNTLLEDMLYVSIQNEDQHSVLQFLSQGANPNRITCHGRTCLGEASRIGNMRVVKILIDACKSTSVQHKSQIYSKKKHRKQMRKLRGVGHPDETLIKCKNFNDKTIKGETSNENVPLSQESHQSEHNQGYFVFKHDESSSSDESKKNIKSPVSPTAAVSTSQAELEWDEEIVNVAPTTSEDEIWSSLYKWYADILESTGSAIASGIKVTYGIDQHDAFMWTALHYAAEQGHAGIVKLILDAGGKVDVASGNGHTPLHIAAKADQIDIVLQLLAAGGHVNYQTHEKMTPLHFAAAKGSEELVRILLRHGAYFDARDASDRTPLYYAAGRGHLDVVKFFIAIGANVNGGDIHGYTPLCQAVWHRHPKVVEILLAFGARITHSHRLLHNAIYHNQEEIVTMLANMGVGINLHNETGDTPLTLSARLSKPAIARILLEKGANPNSCNSITWCNALHTAVDNIDCSKEFEDILISLLDHNIDLNYAALIGDTALSRALLRSNDCAAALLIRHGADVNACNLRICGLNNLEVACKKRTINLANLLIKAGHRIPVHEPYTPMPDPNSTLHFLYTTCLEPLSLFDICRIRIRNRCGNMPLHRYIDALCLPKSLKRCLMLEDVDYFCSI